MDEFDTKKDILRVETCTAGYLGGGKFIILDVGGPIVTQPDGQEVDVGTTVRLAFKREHIMGVIHGLTCVHLATDV